MANGGSLGDFGWRHGGKKNGGVEGAGLETVRRYSFTGHF